MLQFITENAWIVYLFAFTALCLIVALIKDFTVTYIRSVRHAYNRLNDDVYSSLQILFEVLYWFGLLGSAIILVFFMYLSLTHIDINLVYHA
jgi:hypothetical protein